MELQIRPAVPADAPAIAEFNQRLAVETEHRSLDPDTLLTGVRNVLNDPAKGSYFAALDGDRIVGQLMITYEWSDWRNGMFWWIQSVYVDRDYRGRGVFKRLYRHIEELVRGRKDVCGLRLYVEEENVRAIGTYESLGMARTPYRLYEIDFTRS